MKQIEIKNWKTREIIVCGKYESIRDCLEKNRYADLSYANLRYANLSSADVIAAIVRYP